MEFRIAENLCRPFYALSLRAYRAVKLSSQIKELILIAHSRSYNHRILMFLFFQFRCRTLNCGINCSHRKLVLTQWLFETASACVWLLAVPPLMCVIGTHPSALKR